MAEAFLTLGGTVVAQDWREIDDRTYGILTVEFQPRSLTGDLPPGRIDVSLTGEMAKSARGKFEDGDRMMAAGRLGMHRGRLVMYPFQVGLDVREVECG